MTDSEKKLQDALGYDHTEHDLTAITFIQRSVPNE